MLVDPDLGELAVELAAPRAAVPARELLDDHEADVVAVARVLAARVAEPDDEQVERRGAFAPSPGQAHGSYSSELRTRRRRCPRRPRLGRLGLGLGLLALGCALLALFDLLGLLLAGELDGRDARSPRDRRAA